MDQELVTILLTLKGRHDFTKRWLKYASSQKFPFQILIADGSLDDEGKAIVDRHLKDYPNLEVAYHRFPPDKTYADFYAKVCVALSKVKTKYVVFADNDDFYVSRGIQAAAAFLEGNFEYSNCGGDMRHFSVLNNPPIYASKVFHYSSYGKISSLNQETAGERILAHSQNYTPTYYHVWRASELQEYYSLVKERGFKDITFFELLPTMMGVALGKTKVLQEPYLFRQHNSLNTTSGSLRGQNQINRMIADSWSDELKFVKDKIAKVIQKVDGGSYDNALSIIERAVCQYIETMVLREYMSAALRNSKKAFSLRQIFKIVSPYKNRVIASFFHKFTFPSIGQFNVGNQAFNEIRQFLKNASRDLGS